MTRTLRGVRLLRWLDCMSLGRYTEVLWEWRIPTYIRTTYLAYILGTLFGIHFSHTPSPSPNLSGIAYQVIELLRIIDIQ